MAKKDECLHNGGYKMESGVLICAICAEPSKSVKWRNNVYGTKTDDALVGGGTALRKAVVQGKTANKEHAPQDNK